MRRTCPPPGTGRGMGPARYELSRCDDEGDCGRGRSEAKPNGVPPMAAPCERNTKKEGDCQSFDFLVTLVSASALRLLTAGGLGHRPNNKLKVL